MTSKLFSKNMSFITIVDKTWIHRKSRTDFKIQLLFRHFLIPEQHYEKLGQDIPILILYSITFILGIFGNSIVCYVVFRRKITTTTYILIGNLAISDILGSATIPSNLYFLLLEITTNSNPNLPLGQWLLCSSYVLDNYGDRGCGLMKSSQILSYYISTFTMIVIAFDRYRIVNYPLGPRMRPWLPIALMWVFATICVLPTMVSMRISEFFTPKSSHILSNSISIKTTTLFKGTVP